MNTILRSLFTEKFPTATRIGILFGLAHAVLLLMLAFTFPIINEKIGSPAFDLRSFGYSYSEAIQILSSLDKSSVEIYLFPQLFLLDVFYPLLLALFLSNFLKRLYQLNKVENSRFFKIVFLPFAAMICDYIENIFIAYMITNIGHVDKTITSVSSAFTIMKSSFTITSWILVLTLCIQWFILKYQNTRRINLS